ncbi:MAG: hypothetical protein GQ557_01820 [Mycoplasmataceae bacterium]|nr:hypothetical protein [Mycoplasmataceae bacterium]
MQAKVWFRSPSSLLLFIFSTLYIIIFGTLVSMAAEGMPPAQASAMVGAAFGTILTLMILSSASYQFGTNFLIMKDSVLLRRIGASKLTKPQVIGAFLLWALTTLFIVVIYVFLTLYLFSDVLSLIPIFYWSNVNWLGLTVAIIIGAISAYIFSFLLLSLANDTETYNIFNTLYFFFATALGGLFGGNADWMFVFGHATPIGWTADFISNSMSGNEVFHLSNGYDAFSSSITTDTEWGTQFVQIVEHPISGVPIGSQIIVLPWKASMDIFAPLLISGVTGGVALKLFKWD